MKYERMLNKQIQPSEDEILQTIGDTTPWLTLRQYIESHFDVTPEIKFFTKKHGWSIRYARKNKTFCYLFPENGAFSALIVLGAKESQRALSRIDRLSAGTREILQNTEQLHDGRWLWVRGLNLVEVEDIKALLSVKRNPKRQLEK